MSSKISPKLDAAASDRIPPAEASLTGQLLVAMPSLTAQPFAHSVIYICAHSVEDGAMGIVINRRLSQPDFDALMDQLGIAPAPPLRRIGLCFGGPMENSRGFVLHSADWSGDGSLTVNDDMTLTASLDVLRAIAEGAGPARAVLALGHASWGPGQLEDELRENSWIAAPCSEAIVFDGDYDTKWRRALAGLRIDPMRLVAGFGTA